LDDSKEVTRVFKRISKHGNSKRGNAGKEPINPQESLDKTLSISENTTRRLKLIKKQTRFLYLMSI
jgi:hypothetical protein